MPGVREYDELTYAEAKQMARRQMGDGYGDALILHDDQGYWALYYVLLEPRAARPSQAPLDGGASGRPSRLSSALRDQALARGKRPRKLPKRPGLISNGRSERLTVVMPA